MKYLIFSFLLSISSLSYGQDSLAKDTIYKFENLDKQPVFEGGSDQLKTFIQNNLKYPKISRKQKVEGLVVVQFVIEPTGNVTNIEIVKSLDKHVGEEAIRVVSIMPKWTPGQKGGQNVRTYFYLPLRFALPKD